MPQSNSSTAIKERSNTRRKTPDLYEVVLLNDDFTTFEFVIYVLIKVFGLGPEDAVELTSKVHNEGAGAVGRYALEEATEKVKTVHALANTQGFPLRCRIRLLS